jgi:N6-L-threonylcarbamoyladenine synthase
MMSRSFHLHELNGTEAFGEMLAEMSRKGDVFLISGELGAGKTSMCRGFLRRFTGDMDLDVPSPSYLICLQYENQLAGGPTVYHIDPYRLSPGNVSCLLDFESAVTNDILLVEWPSRLGHKLDKLVHDMAGRIFTLSFEGVGPQAVGRNVHVALEDNREGTYSVTDLQTEWERRLSGSETPHSKIARLSVNNSQSISFPSGAVCASGEDVLVMGIESSCDDTAVAILRGDGTIVAQVIASQAAVHEEWGGVVPKLAQEEHAKAIQGTVDACIKKAGITPDQLSAIAVTVGPGLALCLLVGVKKAMEIAAKFEIPLVRIHHMEGHMMVTRLPGLCAEVPQFPFMTLLVSGGHTMIVLSQAFGQHVIMGSTIDDSVGEAFDKTARLLGITSVPGGKDLESLASKGEASRWEPALPKPLSKTRDEALRKGCDMSFAGLKTAVQLSMAAAEKKKADRETEINKADLAAAFQKCCADHLAERLKRALNIALVGDENNSPLVENMRHVVIAGGVAANKTVKLAVTEVAQSFGLTVCVPPPIYCTDNGVMIAWTGIERLRFGLAEPAPKLRDPTDIDRFCEVRPRWPLGVRHSMCLGKLNDQSLRPLDRKAQEMSHSQPDPKESRI